MRGTYHPGKRAVAAIAGGLLAGLVLVGEARGDDLMTLSGKTFHDAQPVRVEPDGVTWHHAEGVCKVDFADSPRSVQEAYHYDAAKAAAYHDARAREQRQAGEQARQLVQAQEQRQRVWAAARAQTASVEAGASSPTGAPTLVYRHGLAPTVEAAVRALDEQADARRAQADADARNSEGLLGAPRLWSLVPGVGSQPAAPRLDRPNTAEYKASLNHAPGDLSMSSSAQDDFYKPLYLTRSYYEDVDRASAFARGTSLK